MITESLSEEVISGLREPQGEDLPQAEGIAGAKALRLAPGLLG